MSDIDAFQYLKDYITNNNSDKKEENETFLKLKKCISQLQSPSCTIQWKSKWDVMKFVFSVLRVFLKQETNHNNNNSKELVALCLASSPLLLLRDELSKGIVNDSFLSVENNKNNRFRCFCEMLVPVLPEEGVGVLFSVITLWGHVLQKTDNGQNSNTIWVSYFEFCAELFSQLIAKRQNTSNNNNSVAPFVSFSEQYSLLLFHCMGKGNNSEAAREICFQYLFQYLSSVDENRWEGPFLALHYFYTHANNNNSMHTIQSWWRAARHALFSSLLTSLQSAIVLPLQQNWALSGESYLAEMIHEEPTVLYPQHYDAPFRFHSNKDNEEEQWDSLLSVMTETIQISNDNSEMVRQALEECRMLLELGVTLFEATEKHVNHHQNHSVPFLLSEEEYDKYMRPLFSIVLRGENKRNDHGKEIKCILSVLEINFYKRSGIVSSNEKGRLEYIQQWKRRLDNGNDNKEDTIRNSISSLFASVEGSASMSDGIENNALFCDFVQENASLVQIQTGLDLLVQYCHHNDNNHNEKTFSLLFPTVIRFLCHAALRVPDSPWSQYTIYSRNNNNHHNSSEDPFATFYLFQALARYILDGCLSCHRTPNIPLARYYSSVLMRCALSYKGISLLTAVREVWHRYATAMVAFDHNTNKNSFWCFLAQKTAADVSYSYDKTNWSNCSLLEDRKQSLTLLYQCAKQKLSHSLSISDLDSEGEGAPQTPYTIVYINRDHHTITLSRCRYNDCFMPSPLTAVRSISLCTVSQWREEYDTPVWAIRQENREQLSQGSGPLPLSVEEGRRRSTQLEQENNNKTMEEDKENRNPIPKKNNDDDVKKDSKDVWWRKRFLLDETLHETTLHLQQNLFKYNRIWLLGELSLSLRSQLWEITERMANRFHIINNEEQRQSAFLSRVYYLLCGLPFLYHNNSNSNEADDRKEMKKTKARYPKQKALYYPHNNNNNDDCIECKTMERQITQTLTDILHDEQWLCTADDNNDNDGDDVVREVVRETLSAFYYDWTELESCHHDNDHRMESHVDLRRLSREHVYLCVQDDAHSREGNLHNVLWEALDVLYPFSVSRVPSSNYVQESMTQNNNNNNNKTEKKENSVYVVAGQEACNNNNNLIRQLQQSSGATSFTFHASSATTPLWDAIRCSHSLYIYAGHSRGEEYIARATLLDRPPPPSLRPPAVWLMSCSAALTHATDYSMPLCYLQAGGPTVLGCLLDVTDGEIDKLTIALLRQREEARWTVGEGLARCRSVCRLPYLTAAATVLYGMNVKL